MIHLAIAAVLFIAIPFALVGAAAIWEHLSNDTRDDDAGPSDPQR